MMNRASLVLAVSLALAPAARAADQAAGVMLGVSGHVTVERQSGGSAQATLGMRLEPADVVAVDRGASAEVYLRGGGVVRLHDATRFTMPKAQDTAPANATRLGSGSIAQLESGLWVLNDPKGSLLVSPMRGDGILDAAEAPVPLTPRYETLTGTAASFVWSGGPEKVRVVVADHREIVWKSPPKPPGTIVELGNSLPFVPGAVYTWWLEPEAGGAPLTAGIPFRIAPADVLERTKSIEMELRTMTGAGAATADYLRVAHYVGAGSWTHVLTLASRMPAGDARSHALEAAAAGLRLDARTAETLAAKLGAGSTR